MTTLKNSNSDKAQKLQKKEKEKKSNSNRTEKNQMVTKLKTRICIKLTLKL